MFAQILLTGTGHQQQFETLVKTPGITKYKAASSIKGYILESRKVKLLCWGEFEATTKRKHNET